MAHFLGKSHQTLREQVCECIATQGFPVFDDFDISQWILQDSGLTCENYAEEMRQPGTWGGAIELACLASLYDLSIFVRIGGRSVHAAGCGDRAVHLDYSGSHYEPFEP